MHKKPQIERRSRTEHSYPIRHPSKFLGRVATGFNLARPPHENDTITELSNDSVNTRMSFHLVNVVEDASRGGPDAAMCVRAACDKRSMERRHSSWAGWPCSVEHEQYS